ncbi:hypothetical protein GDO78_018990 [Eleutherodactylus coqui]|uniref:Uncharacterized protein n=1 Tax=Eleutherodactylus coqui TaxID=57060 RepID=A0A8J6EIP6_ELECQ|nr:hypothetical protein GDO78_018990 [Eleutherodactylus coqui]KAG9470058.1 hypothetical protein GDO78_018990 [Eleutherodactylus coqui]
MLMDLSPSGFGDFARKVFHREFSSHYETIEFARKNAANFLSMANLLMGLSSILCTLNGSWQCAAWLLLIGFMLDLADGAVARQLNTCSALGVYPHDKILESQLWKKMVFAGGVAMIVCSFYPLACLYHLVWSMSYILFPDVLWSFKV